MAGAWVNRIFESKIAQNGGVVRRKLTSVDRYASEQELIDEVRHRGYHMVLHNGQYIIFCDRTASTRIIL